MCVWEEGKSQKRKQKRSSKVIELCSQVVGIIIMSLISMIRHTIYMNSLFFLKLETRSASYSLNKYIDRSFQDSVAVVIISSFLSVLAFFGLLARVPQPCSAAAAASVA